jgi:hypothetical protein
MNQSREKIQIIIRAELEEKKGNFMCRSEILNTSLQDFRDNSTLAP